MRRSAQPFQGRCELATSGHLCSNSELVRKALAWYEDKALVADIREHGLKYVRLIDKLDEPPSQLNHACAVVDAFHTRVSQLVGEGVPGHGD